MEESTFIDQLATVETSRDTAWEDTNLSYYRIVIGKPGAEISGAIYLKKGIELPKAVIIKLNV